MGMDICYRFHTTYAAQQPEKVKKEFEAAGYVVQAEESSGKERNGDDWRHAFVTVRCADWPNDRIGESFHLDMNENGLWVFRPAKNCKKYRSAAPYAGCLESSHCIVEYCPGYREQEIYARLWAIDRIDIHMVWVKLGMLGCITCTIQGAEGRDIFSREQNVELKAAVEKWGGYSVLVEGD
ncbi:MAG: hypothetical protein AAB849_02320 [Patescibacteria group bacterium]